MKITLKEAQQKFTRGIKRGWKIATNPEVDHVAEIVVIMAIYTGLHLAFCLFVTLTN